MKAMLYLLWFLAVAVVGVLAMVPNVMTMHGNTDKILHVTVFCFLTLGPVIALRDIRLVWVSCVALALGAAGIEWAQSFIPLRESSLADLLSSLAGVLVGIIIGFLIRSDIKPRQSGIK